MKLDLNNDLYTDLLNGVSIVAHDFTGEKWGVLARNGNTFTEYQTDEWGEFIVTGHYQGSKPTMIKEFKDRLHGREPQQLPPSRLPRKSSVHKEKPQWCKGMKAGEYEKLFGPLPGKRDDYEQE
jgi:hypothetical protein